MLRLMIAGACALSVAACATPSRFEWGDYENSLYAYSKAPQARENYRKSLQTAIQQGEKTNRLAPGMYAELGYLFLEDNNKPDAIASFQKEMTAFPESRSFLKAVVDRVSGGTAGAPVATPAPLESTPAS